MTKTNPLRVSRLLNVWLIVSTEPLVLDLIKYKVFFLVVFIASACLKKLLRKIKNGEFPTMNFCFSFWLAFSRNDAERLLQLCLQLWIKHMNDYPTRIVELSLMFTYCDFESQRISFGVSKSNVFRHSSETHFVWQKNLCRLCSAQLLVITSYVYARM